LTISHGLGQFESYLLTLIVTDLRPGYKLATGEFYSESYGEVVQFLYRKYKVLESGSVSVSLRKDDRLTVTLQKASLCHSK
jgi:hypothetical protein